MVQRIYASYNTNLLLVQEDGGLVPGSGGAEGGYQPPYDSSMVGLVCPRCSVICRGVAELQVSQC